MRPVNVGVIGLGTVGAGTVDLLARNSAEIARRAGRNIRVTQAAVRDMTRARDCCLLYTSPSPRDQRGSRLAASA